MLTPENFRFLLKGVATQHTSYILTKKSLEYKGEAKMKKLFEVSLWKGLLENWGGELGFKRDFQFN